MKTRRMLNPCSLFFLFKSPAKRIYRFVLCTLIVTICVPALAEERPDDVLKAVVKIKSVIPEDARSAPILGTEREGSGVLIDDQGHILTIGYLILESEEIEITTVDNEILNATYVAYDHESGLGLLRVERPLKFHPLPMGQSSETKVGDPLLIASFGGADAVQGVRVVSRQEFAGYWEYLLEDAIFTTPPYSHFGGAALINRDGRLIGIGSLFTQVMIPELGTILSNMFVPVDRLKPVLNDLIDKGRSPEPPRPWLGLYVQEAQGRIFTVRVVPGGPSDHAGIRPGDIILQVNGKNVDSLGDFYRQVWALGQAGIKVPLNILQGTELRSVVVKSGNRECYFRYHPSNE